MGIWQRVFTKKALGKHVWNPTSNPSRAQRQKPWRLEWRNIATQACKGMWMARTYLSRVTSQLSLPEVEMLLSAGPACWPATHLVVAVGSCAGFIVQLFVGSSICGFTSTWAQCFNDRRTGSRWCSEPMTRGNRRKEVAPRNNLQAMEGNHCFLMFCF